MAYKVFTSYAVLDRNRPMMKFMKRLSEVLRAKLGTRDPSAIQNLIFFDFTSIRPGDEWDLALAQAVQGRDASLFGLADLPQQRVVWPRAGGFSSSV